MFRTRRHDCRWCPPDRRCRSGPRRTEWRLRWMIQSRPARRARRRPRTGGSRQSPHPSAACQVDRLCGNRQSATDWCAEDRVFAIVPAISWSDAEAQWRKSSDVTSVWATSAGTKVRPPIRLTRAATAASTFWLASYVQSARCFRPPLASNSNTETTAGPAAIRLQSLGASGTDSANPDPHPAAAHTRITANTRTCAAGTRG